MKYIRKRESRVDEKEGEQIKRYILTEFKKFNKKRKIELLKELEKEVGER